MSGRYILETAIAVCGAFVALAFLTILLANFEGDWFPVTDQLDPGRIVEVEGGILIHPSFEKRRACTYVSVQFFRGSRDGIRQDVEIDLKYGQGKPDRNVTRPTGAHRTLPWFIGMSKQEFLTNSFSIVSHRCWNPLYLTHTVFWESR